MIGIRRKEKQIRGKEESIKNGQMRDRETHRERERGIKKGKECKKVTVRDRVEKQEESNKRREVDQIGK